MVGNAYKIIILLFLSLYGYPEIAQAQETITMGRSYRSLAMGNTGVASASDSSALFYNPAILANVTSWWVDYSAWTIEVSDGFKNEEYPLMIGAINFPYLNIDGLSNDQKSTFLEKDNPYIRGTAGANLAINLSQRGWTVAGNYMYEVLMTTKDDGANIYQRFDKIQKVGMSIPIGLGQWVLGVNGTMITRKSATDPSTDTITTWGEENSGIGYDVGILYRMSNKARVTLGVVVQNYGDITFGDVTGDTEPQMISVGASMNHEWGPFRLVLALDVRDLQTDRDRKQTIHAGLELGMFPNSTGGSFLTYRSGYNNGYLSQGLELNFGNHSMIVGYTVYSEEVGTYPEKVASLRRVGYFSMGF